MKVVAQHTICTAASREAIWAKLADWKRWTEWDTGMEKVTFTGALAEGSRGSLKLKGGPEVELVIKKWLSPDSYQNEFTLLGSRFVFDHQVIASGNGHNMTFTISVDGFFAELFSFKIASDFRKSLPIWMTNFKTQIETE